MPASIADVLIVGVGDPRQGSFIDGRMSRQDASTLRQIAARLGGIYHDGNRSTSAPRSLKRLTVIPRKSAFEQLTRREYALIACGLGASVLAFLPVLLHHFGTRGGRACEHRLSAVGAGLAAMPWLSGRSRPGIIPDVRGGRPTNARRPTPGPRVRGEGTQG